MTQGHENSSYHFYNFECCFIRKQEINFYTRVTHGCRKAQKMFAVCKYITMIIQINKRLYLIDANINTCNRYTFISFLRIAPLLRRPSLGSIFLLFILPLHTFPYNKTNKLNHRLAPFDADRNALVSLSFTRAWCAACTRTQDRKEGCFRVGLF